MKKIFTLVMLFIGALALVACNNETVPVGSVKLLKVELVDTLPETADKTESMTLLSAPVQSTVVTTESLFAKMNLTSFETITGAKEYLAIYVQQPEDVLESISIDMVIIKLPNGKLQTWEDKTVLSADDNRGWFYSQDNREVIYIPVLVNSNPGTYEYSIEQVRYTDANGERFRVDKGAEDLEKVVVIVSYPLLFNSNPGINDSTSTWNVGVYDKVTRRFNLQSVGNLSGRKIFDIWINDSEQPVFSLNRPITPYEEFVLPAEFEVETNEFLKVTMTYAKGENEVGTYTGYVVDPDGRSNPNDINIYNETEFRLIDRGFIQQIVLRESIIIDYEFEPFKGHRLILVIIEDCTITYTFSSVMVLYESSEPEQSVFIDSAPGNDVFVGENYEVWILQKNGITVTLDLIGSVPKISIKS